jgi:hypothetical protein
LYILYLDESGTHADARYFVVAGIALYETDTFHLAQSLDGLQARFLPGNADHVPLHVSTLRSGFGKEGEPFSALDKAARRTLVNAVYAEIARSRARLFGVAMDKSWTRGDCYERGFEEIVNRFDRMLARVSRESPTPKEA